MAPQAGWTAHCYIVSGTSERRAMAVGMAVEIDSVGETVMPRRKRCVEWRIGPYKGFETWVGCSRGASLAAPELAIVDEAG